MKNQCKKDRETTHTACKTTASKPSKCGNLTKTFETLLGRLKLNIPCSSYLSCCLPIKKNSSNHQKAYLPSKQELEQRCYPPNGTFAVSPVTRVQQRPKIETPYWAVRQRLPKSAVLYEKSKVSSCISPQELSPACLAGKSFQNHLATIKSPKTYENSSGLYRKNSRPKIKLATSNLKTRYSSEYRDSVSSVDSSYKTLPCSRRTSGYSSAGSEFSAAVAQVEMSHSSCNKLEATPEVNEKIEDVKQNTTCSTFEDRDGYKCLTYKNYNRSFGHEYVND